MSEITTENKKYFVIKKTTTDDVFFYLSPISNSSVQKAIYLTKRNPNATLPLDWALGIFLDDSLFGMFRQGCFTFDNVEELTKAAIEAGIFFGDLDFTPAPANYNEIIFNILKAGNRQGILEAIDKYGKNKVQEVAVARVDSLTTNVVRMLENIFSIQLTMDGE